MNADVHTADSDERGPEEHDVRCPREARTAGKKQKGYRNAHAGDRVARREAVKAWGLERSCETKQAWPFAVENELAEQNVKQARCGEGKEKRCREAAEEPDVKQAHLASPRGGSHATSPVILATEGRQRKRQALNVAQARTGDEDHQRIEPGPVEINVEKAKDRHVEVHSVSLLAEEQMRRHDDQEYGEQLAKHDLIETERNLVAEDAPSKKPPAIIAPAFRSAWPSLY